MNNRGILYLSLIFLAYLIYMKWQADHAPQPQTPTAQVSGAQTAKNSTVPSAGGSSSEAPMNESDEKQVKDGVVTVKTDVLELEIALKGGSIVQTDLPTYPQSLDEGAKPERILDAEKAYAAQSGLLHEPSDRDIAPTHLSQFTSAAKEYTLADGQDKLVVALKWRSAKGVSVTKEYEFKRGQFEVTMRQTVQNNTRNDWNGRAYYQIKHGEPQGSGNMLFGVQAFNGGALLNSERDYQKISFDKMADIKTDSELQDEFHITHKGGWVSILQHYFISAWLGNEEEENSFFTNYSDSGEKIAYFIGYKSPEQTIAAGDSKQFTGHLYVGPKTHKVLGATAEKLEKTVDYGIFDVISKPLFLVLQWVHGFVFNWGWAIIILTVMLKALFFWPSAVSYKSMANMKKLQPKMKELNTRFKDNPQAKQKAVMEIYKKEGVNPLSGCLPMLIQIPVFMALYWVLLESVEIRQQPWIMWYKDLSIKDPFFVLPVLFGLSMWVQQKLNPQQLDATQQKIFAWLPVVFTAMFLFFPAGLVLYWVVNNILSIAQQWYITRKIVGDG